MALAAAIPVTTGTVSITGNTVAGSSKWNDSSTLGVGYYGPGYLRLYSGGSVSTTSAGYIGGYTAAAATGAGTVSVDGANSKWTDSSTLNVGYYGNGNMTITNAGAVSDTNGFIGGASSTAVGTGSVSVGGTSSTWTNSGTLNVGYYASSGSLSITTGGTVSDATGYIGGASASYGTGTATVDGTNAKWTNTTALDVGYYRTGSLTISNGGSVTTPATATSFYVGYYSGSSGTLNILNGGTLTTGVAYIGGNSSSNTGTGTVTVDDPSTWTLTGAASVPTYLYIGAVRHRHTLNITNGGIVNNYYKNTSGTTYLSGATYMWDYRHRQYGRLGHWRNARLRQPQHAWDVG